MKLLHVVWLILLLPLWSYAQQDCHFTVRGHVVDAHSGQPLGFAHVYIHAQGKGAQCDSSGSYVISSLCSGHYTLNVSYLGTILMGMDLHLRSDTLIDLRPEIHPEELNEAEIAIVGPAKASETRLNMIQPGKLSLIGTDIAATASSLPGVSQLQTGRISKPVIHGMTGSRVILVDNGVRLESQQWGVEHAPEITVSERTRVTVLKDAGTLVYGADAIGGVVLTEQMTVEDTLHVLAVLEGQSNGRGGKVRAVVEDRPGKRDRFYYRLSGETGLLGTIKTPDYFLDNTGHKQQAVGVLSGYTSGGFEIEGEYKLFNATTGIFSGSHIGNLTDLRAALASERPETSDTFSYSIGRPRQEVVHETARMGLEWKTGRSLFSVGYSQQYNLRQEFDKHVPRNDSIAALNLPALHLEMSTRQLRGGWDYRVREMVYKLGVEGAEVVNTFEGRLFIPNYVRYVTGTYVLFQAPLSNRRIYVDLGARFDAINQSVYRRLGDHVVSTRHNFSGLSGTASATFQLRQSRSLQIRTGSSWRAPSINELYSSGLHHGAAAMEYGDTTLREERMLHVGLIYNWRTEKSELVVEGYFNRFNNFIYLRSAGRLELTIRGAFPVFEYANAPARVMGTDVRYVTAIQNGLKVHVTGSYIAARTAKKQYLPFIPANRIRCGITFEPWKKAIEFGAYVTAVARQYAFEESFELIAPPSGYALLSATIRYRLRLGSKPLELLLVGENLSNQRYREYMNRLRYFTNDAGLNIQLKASLKI
ncbi:MAG: hypothetical protein RL226_707 [Bacteroidota bacterium]|jgi:iron complex outermembrane receptor protein